MAEGRAYSLGDALQAQRALRETAGLQQETFPMEAFVGMISDEVEMLRDKGMSDEQIVSQIRQHSSIDLPAGELAANYAPPEERLQHGERHP